MKIGIITGSTRKGRLGAVITDWFHGEVAQDRTDVEFVFLDLADQNLPFFTGEIPPSMMNHDAKYEAKAANDWAAKIAPLDAFIAITPEYNRGPSAVLKNAFDTLYREWKRKPIGFIGYGSTGGVRAIEQLRSNVLQMEMFNATTHVALNVFEYFDDAGKIVVPKKYVSVANAMIDEIIEIADATKSLRP